MNLAWLKTHCAIITTGFTDATLADFLRDRVVADGTHQTKSKAPTLEYWIKALSLGVMDGAHDFNNLTSLLGGYGTIWGKDYSRAIAYCMQRAQGFCPPPYLVGETNTKLNQEVFA